MHISACAAGIVVAVVINAGCGKGNNLAQVDGVVRMNGQPLTKGIITFTPSAGRSASGAVGGDGTFRLGTFAKTDGALVGTHRITITATETPAGPPNFDVDRPGVAPQSPSVPVRYSSADTSGLTFEVKAGEQNHTEIELTDG